MTTIAMTHIKHVSYIYNTKRHRPIIQTNTPLAHARGGRHICASTFVWSSAQKLSPFSQRLSSLHSTIRWRQGQGQQPPPTNHRRPRPNPKKRMDGTWGYEFLHSFFLFASKLQRHAQLLILLVSRALMPGCLYDASLQAIARLNDWTCGAKHAH